MSGCIAFTKLNGEVEAELFPQIWEQIDNKYYERRLLVAESCGVLIPHIPVSPILIPVPIPIPHFLFSHFYEDL